MELISRRDKYPYDLGLKLPQGWEVAQVSACFASGRGITHDVEFYHYESGVYLTVKDPSLDQDELVAFPGSSPEERREPVSAVIAVTVVWPCVACDGDVSMTFPAADVNLEAGKANPRGRPVAKFCPECEKLPKEQQIALQIARELCPKGEGA